VRDARLSVLGLLFPLAVLVGCTGKAAAPHAEPEDVAVPSYAPPSGAPALCAALAGTTHVTGLGTTLGTLTTRPEDVVAGLDLAAAIDELQGVLDEVGDQPARAALRTSLEKLVGALWDAREHPLTDAVRTRISAGLDDVGSRAQAVCGFPA
jgi:hypothetical protein